MDATSTTPAIGKLHIDAAPANGGMDPALFALMGNKSCGDGLFGGGNGGGGILPLLLLSMFQRGGGGLFGGNGGSDAAVAQGITTSKDVAQQLNTFQSWASTNATQLATQIAGIDKSICCSSREIIEAVSALTPQLYQGFAAQAMQSCQQTAQLATAIERTAHDTQDHIMENGKALAAGFAAGALSECQTQNLVNTTSAATNFNIQGQANELAKQLAACCCENRLAIANQNSLIERSTAGLSNQLNMQTCELKTQGNENTAAILAKLNQQDNDSLRAQLSDAKTALSNAEQTAAIAALIKANCPVVA